MIYNFPVRRNEAPPTLPLRVVHLEALSASLEAAGIHSTAAALIRHLSRNLVSRLNSIEADHDKTA